MSNSSLQRDQDALRESAIAVITYVRDAMNDGVALLRDHDEHRLDSEIQAINENLRRVNKRLQRAKRSELTMTIVAPTSAGKSTIINAIAGQELLPSRPDPMTVLPTEIVFSREVKKPEFVLDEDLMIFLSEAWRLLHQKLQQIGLEKTIKQAMENDFPREDIIEEIFNSSFFSLADVKESNSIESDLIRMNDLLRLCGIFGIATDFLSSLSEIPRIEVPFPPKLDLGLGTLVLVDTAGVSEDKSLNLVNVVKEQLKASSLVLVVVDYMRIGEAENQVKVKELIDEIAEVKGRDCIYIIVNKIDERDPNNPNHLSPKQILNLVKTQYKIDDPQNRVFEMSAVEAFLATNFQREEKICSSTELRKSNSFEALGKKYYAKSWRTQKTTVTLEEMKEAADICLQDSGFVEFIDKAIALLVKDAAPSMITIKGALNDISQKFASFLSCLSKQKGILERDIQQLQIEINQLEIDLSAIKQSIVTHQFSQNLMSKVHSELNIVLDSERSTLITEISNNRNYLVEILKHLDNNGHRSFTFENYVEIEMVEKINDFVSKTGTLVEFYGDQLTQKFINSLKQLIEQTNNDLNYLHKSVITKASQRLHKKIYCNLKSDEYTGSILVHQAAVMQVLPHEFREYEISLFGSGKIKMPFLLETFGEGVGGYYERLSTEQKSGKRLIIVASHEYRMDRYTVYAFSHHKLGCWLGSIRENFEKIGQNIICGIEKQLNEDIDAFIQQRDNLLKEYERSLQFTLHITKKKQNDYTITVSQYKQLLDKTASLETDLKYQQEYSKLH